MPSHPRLKHDIAGPTTLARIAGLALAVGAGPVLVGCVNNDSFLDPSVLGRWERTPTVVPILERIAAIEDSDGEIVDYSEVSTDDLVPQVDEYTISPGDGVQLTIWDLVIPGAPETLPRVVDQNGYVEIPQLGRIFLAGQTEVGANQALVRALEPLIQDPLVSVVITSRRTQSYSLQGNVSVPGVYPIPAADYKLLEALISAGGVNEATSTYIYVIRQVALDERTGTPGPESGAAPRTPPTTTPATSTTPAQTTPQGPRTEPLPAEGDELLEIIERLSQPAGGDDGAPSVMGSGVASGARAGSARRQPAADEPLVDLVEPDPVAAPVAPVASASGNADGAAVSGPGRWLFLNGQWVRAVSSPDAVSPGGGAAATEEERLVTQRVIRVPVKPLLAGDARYNLVVRPGDVIRVPPPEAGNVYMAGQVARPGVYSLPVVGRLTLTRAITASGGLSGLAIPERVDLTRMVGPDRQATIMLNLRAIAEQTQPDVFLKADDQVNVGTNFWALPLAVVRGGFRASYGFGFLLDRNFGNDVFGAPPINQQGN